MDVLKDCLQEHLLSSFLKHTLYRHCTNIFNCSNKALRGRFQNSNKFEEIILFLPCNYELFVNQFNYRFLKKTEMNFNVSFVSIAMEILYKGMDQIAWKQLWRPEGSHLSDMQQFIFIIVNSILLNWLGCLPFGLQTSFSSYSKTS